MPIQRARTGIYPEAGMTDVSPARLRRFFAMLLLEALGDQSGQNRIQVFGTDISEPPIQQARTGIYPEAGVTDVSPARLRRFFVKVEGGYQVGKPVREACVFARH